MKSKSLTSQLNFMTYLFTFLKRSSGIAKNICVAAILFFVYNDVTAQNILAGLASNGGPEGRGTAFSLGINGGSFSVIKGFEDWGTLPNSSLLKDADGNFYGTTSRGGTYNAGTVFSITPAGKITILKQFNLNVDGGYADGELIKGADGYFYGLTGAGGVNGYGTIFKISAAGDFSVIKSFVYATDGANPHGHLTLASDGNFYGITHGGGANYAGTIFKLTPGGVYTVIHNMNKTTEGGDSYASLTEGKDGNLYGVTYDGGTYGYGTIFKVTKNGALTVLKHLNQSADGGYPQCDLIQASDNNFYGTCYNGGSIGYGTIFKITTGGTYNVIKHLSYSTDGANPYGGLMQNTDGNFYGITAAGGSNGAGTIYKLTPNGVYGVIHIMNATTDGNNSASVFVNGSDNNLYALCNAGGTNDQGTAFKVSTTGTLTVIANFNGSLKYGNAPYSTFIKGADSAYYATLSSGGANGFGSVIKICGGVTSTVYSFNKTTDGAHPKGKLLLANDGNFYGMTNDGGVNNSGTVFKITAAGKFTLLHAFNGTSDGGNPFGGLIQASDGLLYGMTSTGGTNINGTVFKIGLAGNNFSVVHHFLNTTDGAAPNGDLVQATDGNFYGMTLTNAKIFKLTGAGVFTVIHSFISSSEGYVPLGSLIQGIDGNLYGTCSDGGASLGGTVFQCTLNGTLKVVCAFNANTNGKAPKGTLLQGADGTLYGASSAGGTYNAGTIFKVAPKQGSALTVLHSMNLDADGGTIYGGLIFAPVNNLIANAQTITTNEDTKKSITLTGTGGSPLEFNIVNKPIHGALTGTGANVVYRPRANYAGKDSFSFSVSVGCLSSKPTYIKITVKAVADTPVLAPIGNKTVAKNSTLTFTASATDADLNQTITYSLIGAPAGATINASTGTFSWKPTTAGSYTFKVRATDNGTPPLYDEEQITVTVSNSLIAGEVADMKAGNNFTAGIYPDPVVNEIHVTTSQFTGDVAISIIDMKGSIISNKTYQGNNNFIVDASRLANGIYILQLQSGSNTKSFRFIKQ